MTSVIFITGLSANEKEYQGLIDYIKGFYGARLPKTTPLHVTRWDRDVAHEISIFAPTGDLVIVGFSFGGQKAVDVCGQLTRVIKRLILLDPVNFRQGNTRNTVGFSIPANVKQAWCFNRGATTAPWSGHISHGSTEWLNKQYKATTKDPHGEYVWKSETMDLVRGGL